MNNLAFTSPYTALLWERFRYVLRNSYWVLVFILLPYLVILFINWLEDDSFLNISENFLKFSAIFLMILQLLICIILLSEKNIKSMDMLFPLERHYILPVNSYTLGLFQAFFNITTIVLFWSIFLNIHYYVYSDSVVHAADWFMCASHWSLGITCYLAIIITRLALSSFSKKTVEAISLIIGNSYLILGIFYTSFFPSTIIGVIGIILILFVSPFYIKAMSKLNQNEEINYMDIASIYSFDWIKIFQKKFITPFQAQLWYEWREWGIFVSLASIWFIIIRHLFLSDYQHDTFELSLSTDYFNSSTFLSLWILIIAGTLAKAQKNKNNRYEFILPIETEFLYYVRLAVSLIICLFCVALPQIIFYSHNLNSSDINFIEIFILIIFTISLGILILANPITSIILNSIYFTIIILIYIFPEQIVSIPLLFFTFFVLLINIYLYNKCAYKNLIYYPVLAILFAGLLGSFFIFSRNIEGILFTLFMLMTYFIGLHWFVRSRCR